MTNDNVPVSIVGLGSMGSAIAAALLAAGHPTTVWNRTPAAADPLVDRGARRAETVREAVAAAQLVVVCLLDDAVARAVVDPGRLPLDGRVLINLTSGTPTGARAWAAAVPAYVSGAIVAMPEQVGSADALLLASGGADVLRRAEPILAVLGRVKRLGEDPALAPAHDMALQSAMYGLYAGAQHAAALVDSVGGAHAAFGEELLVPWLAGMVPFIVSTAAPGGGVPAELRPDSQAVALGNLLRASEVQGVDAVLTGHLQATLELMRRAVAAR